MRENALFEVIKGAQSILLKFTQEREVYMLSFAIKNYVKGNINFDELERLKSYHFHLRKKLGYLF